MSKFECLFSFGIIDKRLDIVGLQQARDLNKSDKTISLDTIIDLDPTRHCLFPITQFKEGCLEEIRKKAHAQIDKVVNELKGHIDVE